MFELCDKLDNECPNFTFGTTRQQDCLFVNGQKLDMELPTEYEALRDFLLAKKLIKYPEKEEE